MKLPRLSKSVAALNPHLPDGAKASARGSEAQRVGAAAEKVVKIFHDQVAWQGRGRLDFVQARVGQTKAGRIIYREKSTPDALGWVTVPGVSIAVPCAVEVKGIAAGAFSVSRVEDHQADYLNRLANNGGVAVLALVWGDLLRFPGLAGSWPNFGAGSPLRVYAVPWTTIFRGGTVAELTVARWRVTPDTYLDAVAAHWRQRFAERLSECLG